MGVALEVRCIFCLTDDSYTDFSEHIHFPSTGPVLRTEANNFCGKSPTAGLFPDIINPQLVCMHIKSNGSEMAREEA